MSTPSSRALSSGEREPWDDGFVDALCTRDGQAPGGETAFSATWKPKLENHLCNAGNFSAAAEAPRPPHGRSGPCLLSPFYDQPLCQHIFIEFSATLQGGMVPFHR